MSRPARYRGPESFERVNLSQIAREIGRSRHDTAKLLQKAERLGLLRPRVRSSKRSEITYDAVAIDVLKTMIGVPSRPAPQPGDWLSTYLGDTNARHGDPHHPGSPQP